jgi:hypothetical protein
MRIFLCVVNAQKDLALKCKELPAHGELKKQHPHPPQDDHLP